MPGQPGEMGVEGEPVSCNFGNILYYKFINFMKYYNFFLSGCTLLELILSYSTSLATDSAYVYLLFRVHLVLLDQLEELAPQGTKD